MLSTNITNSDSKKANTSKFFIGNTIPPLEGAYIPWSTLFSSYYLLLNHAIIGISKPYLTKEKLAVIKTLLKAARIEIKTETANLKSKFPRAVCSPALKEVDHFIKHMSQNKPFRKILDFVSRLLSSKTIREKTGQQALLELVDATEKCRLASDLQMPNNYNMPILLSEDTVVSHAPRFSFPGLESEYEMWKDCERQGKKMVSMDLQCTDMCSALSQDMPENAFFPPMYHLSKSDKDSFPARDQANWSMSVSFTGFGSIPIVPGNWFGKNNILLSRRYLSFDGHDFFGKNGSMALLPSFAVIGYQPKIKIKSSTSQHHDALIKTIETNSNFLEKIGPFQFDHSQKSPPLEHRPSLTISYDAGRSQTPGLLGIISLRLAND